MQKKRTTVDNFFLFLKGLIMGAANKVPGVSGGVVAFVAGFYEEFIDSLKNINAHAFKLLFKGEFKALFKYINAKFLGLLILGMLFSYFSVSRLLDYLLKFHELYVWSVFFGMVFASVFFIIKDFKEWSKKSIIAIIIGVSIGITIMFIKPAEPNTNLFFIFLCGIISVSGMTLPGLSGSFILILLGNYVLLLVDSVNYLYDTILEIIKGDFSFIYNEQRLEIITILMVFTLGSAVGMITLSKLLSYIMHRFHGIMTGLLIGFITGSLGGVWPWKARHTANNSTLMHESYLPSFNSAGTWYAICYILFGISIVFFLEWYGKRQKN